MVASHSDQEHGTGLDQTKGLAHCSMVRRLDIISQRPGEEYLRGAAPGFLIVGGMMMTTEANQGHHPGPKPDPEPPQVPGKVPCSEPESDAIGLQTPIQNKGEVGDGVVDGVVAGEQVDDAVNSGSEQGQAEPKTHDAPEYLWSCHESDTFGSPHALASHSGKSKHLEGDHSPMGMVDTTTSEVVWPWSHAREAYHLFNRLKGGETLAQVVRSGILPPGAQSTTRLRPNEPPSKTATTTSTRTPTSTPNAKVSGTPSSQDRTLGCASKPVVWWLDPRLSRYYDKVSEGILRRGVILSDNFPQFLFKTCTGYLLEHHADLSLEKTFISELQQVVQEG